MGLTTTYAIDTSLTIEERQRSVYWQALALGYTSENAYRIARIMQEEQNNFVSEFMNWPPENFPADQYRDEFEFQYTWDKLVHWKRNIFANKINERSFLASLAKPIYNRLSVGDSVVNPTTGELVCQRGEQISTINPITGNEELFYQSNLFRQSLSNMRKDLLYIIRYNMLDQHGNIAPQYEFQPLQNQTIKTLVRGGYSIGSEIVQMAMNTNVIYR